MKLSEAIRLGAMLKPQGREHLRRDNRTCAFGAAFDAVGELANSVIGERSFMVMARALWPIVDNEVKCPIAGTTRHLGSMILSLNDEDEWTREQIADWVATIEAQQDATSLDTPQIQEPVRA